MFQRRKGSMSNKSITVSSISSVSDCERAINLSVNLIKTSDTNIINQCSSNTNIRVGIPSKIDLYTRKKKYYRNEGRPHYVNHVFLSLMKLFIFIRLF
jgi:nicotinic acid mononucleotide adenylyltransferase